MFDRQSLRCAQFAPVARVLAGPHAAAVPAAATGTTLQELSDEAKKRPDNPMALTVPTAHAISRWERSRPRGGGIKLLHVRSRRGPAITDTAQRHGEGAGLGSRGTLTQQGRRRKMRVLAKWGACGSRVFPTCRRSGARLQDVEFYIWAGGLFAQNALAARS